MHSEKDLAERDLAFVEDWAKQCSTSVSQILEELFDAPMPMKAADTPTTVTNGRFTHIHIGFQVESAPDQFDFTGLDNLESMTLEMIDSRTIDVSGLRGLKKLDLAGLDELSSLVLKDNAKLETLDVTGTALKVLDISQVPNLKCLSYSGTSLSVDVGKMSKLEELSCSETGLEKLVAPASLIYLDCRDNELNSLDVSSCTRLQRLGVSGNPLGALNVSACTELISLYAAGCELIKVELSNNRRLRILDLAGNRLSALHTGAMSKLFRLQIQENQISDVDLSENHELVVANLDENELTQIDVGNNLALQCLHLQHNKLVNLDVSTNWRLSMLDIGDNPSLKTIVANEFQRQRLANGTWPDKKVRRAKRFSLHHKAVNYDWDSGMKGLTKIIKNKDCDLGTALRIYWLCKPLYYCQYETRAACRKQESYSLESWDLITDIEERVQKKGFRTSEIFFDPRNDEGNDWTAITYDGFDRVRNLPEVMFEPSMKGPGPRVLGNEPDTLN
jgi:Leucine-rich repeat (LRR) protein